MDISRKILLGAVKSERIPNAYLFVGADSKALSDEAFFLANALDCKGPDLVVISSSGKSIKINEIRQISSFVKYGPSQCKWKIIVVQDADQMTEEASNSFLKSLEEPHSNILFILTTTREPHILKTIQSRCQKIVFSNASSSTDEKADEMTDKFLNIKDMDLIGLFSLSDELAQHQDPAELLNSALNNISCRQDLKTTGMILALKEMFSAVRSLERKANKRLTLDDMLLSMKEAY